MISDYVDLNQTLGYKFLTTTTKFRPSLWRKNCSHVANVLLKQKIIG